MPRRWCICAPITTISSPLTTSSTLQQQIHQTRKVLELIERIVERSTLSATLANTTAATAKIKQGNNTTHTPPIVIGATPCGGRVPQHQAMPPLQLPSMAAVQTQAADALSKLLRHGATGGTEHSPAVTQGMMDEDDSMVCNDEGG